MMLFISRFHASPISLIRCASQVFLLNFQSDRISLVDASINNIIRYNVERMIEKDNLLVSDKTS
jgi:hypothetical protein